MTGATKSGDDVVETAYREAVEETGITIDKLYVPHCLGGWNRRKAKYATYNDNLFCITIKTTSLNYKVDGYEITKASWFPINELLTIDTNVTIFGDLHSFSIER